MTEPEFQEWTKELVKEFGKEGAVKTLQDTEFLNSLQTRIDKDWLVEAVYKLTKWETGELDNGE